jgi:ABC-type transporter Mla subunit MlaD
MPLQFGKIFAVIALLTVAAFVLWLLWGSFFQGETVEEQPAALNSVPSAAKLTSHA